MRVLWVVLVGCGRLGFDAAPDAPATLVITPLTTLNTSDREDDPSLTADMLDIFFNVDGAIWTSRRATLAETWPAPTRIAELDAEGILDTNCEISADGLTLYFGSRRTGAGLNDIWMATRPNRDAPWDPPVRIVELATASDEVPGMPDAAGTRMVFERMLKLFESTRANTSSPWSPATATNFTLADAASGFLDPTGSIVAFEAASADGTFDLFLAPRGANGFDPPTAITAIDVGADDRDPWISCDGRHLFFASDRQGGSDDLYEAIFPAPLWTPRCD